MTCNKYFVFAGSWSKERTVGLRSYQYNPECKKLTTVGVYGEYPNMSCMVTDGDLLFACAEAADLDIIASYRINPEGGLEMLSNIHVEAFSIAHLFLDQKRRIILASSMASAKLILLKYDMQGEMKLLDTVIFSDLGSLESGFSTNPRQSGSRIHSAFLAPDGTHIHVCNLGSDKIYVLELDGEKLKFLPHLTYTVEGGEGPRHIVYSRDGRFAYVNAEMGNHIHVFALGEDGSLKILQKVSTLDPTQENPPKGEISVSAISHDGKFLFCCNRGQNGFVRFAVQEDGLLTVAGYYDCWGEVPRGMTFDCNDGALLFCNNRSGTITVLDYDQRSGTPGECLQVVDDIPNGANVICVAYQ